MLRRATALVALILLFHGVSYGQGGPGGGPGPGPTPIGSAGSRNLGKSVVDPGTGSLEAALPPQSIAGGSHTYVTADLQKMTRRSNAGSAMSDTLPATGSVGLVQGAMVNVFNVDASGTDTITAGAGTTINGASSFALKPGVDVWWTYDAAAFAWRPIDNSAGALLAANNLSDVASTSTARTNLGLGTAAQQVIAFFLQAANNLSDLANAATARTNLGLGSAATQASSFFAQVANNLSDLTSAPTARLNLGLGTSATINTGTSGATIPLLNGGNTWSGIQTFLDGSFFDSNGLSIVKLLSLKGVPGETVVPLTCTGGTVTIDLSAGTIFSCTVSASATISLAVSNCLASGTGQSFMLKITNGGTPQTVNWLSGTKWPGAAPPGLTTAGRDDLVFESDDGCSTWDGFISGLNMG